MRLLFDQNLSPRLAQTLHDLYPESAHVRNVGLDSADDLEVWTHARDNGYAVVSKDSDFRQLSFILGHPPKVIWIRRGNCSTAEVESIPRDRYADITAFDRDDEGAFLALS